MSWKYDNLRLYWAGVAEKKKHFNSVYSVNSVYAKVPILSTGILNTKSAFSLVNGHEYI